MAFGFGAASTPAASSPFGGFGAASTPTFSGASTPAFGAASTPAFGATPFSTPGFGASGFAASTPSLFGGGAASSASLFGAAASTPAFGAASTPSLFGATPASSASAFGATSTPSLFGGAASTPSLFGGAASTPSLFGAASGGAFGAASTPSLFGGAAASTPSLFGGASSSPFGGFGLAQPAATSTPSLFGGAGAPTAGGAGAGQLVAYGAGQPADSMHGELQHVLAAYNPTSSMYRFHHIFISVVPNPQQRVKPGGRYVDELRWKQALKECGGPNNPDQLWPVVAYGFEGLAERAQAHTRTLAEQQQRLDELRAATHTLRQRLEVQLQDRAERVRQRQVELSQQLLGVARHVDGLEGRLAMYMGGRGDASRTREAGIAAALDRVEGELSSAAAGGLQRRLDALAAAARLWGGSQVARGGAAALQSQALDEASTEQLFRVLKEHVDAVKQLQALLRQDILDTEVMRGEGAREAAGGRVGPAGLNVATVEVMQ